MEIRDLLLPTYQENFPENLLPALLRYANELAAGVKDYYDTEEFDDAYCVWSFFDLTLQKSLLEELPAEVLEMEDEEAFEKYGECDILSYRMMRWLEDNVDGFGPMQLKLLSIINLRYIAKKDCVIVSVNEEEECLDITVDREIMKEEERRSKYEGLADDDTPFFTWPAELKELYV